MIKRYILVLAIAFGFSAACLNAKEPTTPAKPSAQREVRAFWNHSGTGAYPGDWDRTAKELSQAGFNTIMPNMLWGGAAHYDSKILPTSTVFQRHGDQIAQCVEAAHRHGLKVHVWKVCWNLGHYAPNDFIQKMRDANRTQVSVDGKTKDWLCPSHPENFKLELDSMLEVARNYPADGLHFDYIRYPSTDWCFCDGCRKRFEADTNQKVAHWPEDCHRGALRKQYNAWRRKQITRLVETVSREAKKIRPGIKISAAVYGSYPGCKNGVAQDWAAWAKEGHVDFLCPMNYTNSDKTFARLLINQIRLVEGRVPIYPGIGAAASRSKLSADRVLDQIGISRRLGAGGFVIFNLRADTMAKLVPAVGRGMSAAGSRQ